MLTADDINERIQLNEILDEFKADSNVTVSEAAYDADQSANLDYREKAEDKERKL